MRAGAALSLPLGVGITLQGEEGALAVLSYTLHAQTPEETLIVGTKGYIKIHAPAHCPSRITVTTVGGREDTHEAAHDLAAQLTLP